MPIDQSNLYSSYQRASRYSPVDQSTLKKALRPYGLRLGSLAGKTDSQLRQMAITAVLAKRKGAAKKPKVTPKAPKPPAPVGPTDRSAFRLDPIRRPRRRNGPPRYQI